MPSFTPKHRPYHLSSKKVLSHSLVLLQYSQQADASLVALVGGDVARDQRVQRIVHMAVQIFCPACRVYVYLTMHS